MEKGKDESDEENPFSFKAFLKRGAEDTVEKKRGKKPGTRKNQKKAHLPADAAAQGDNPFSFKHFIATRGVNDDDTSNVVKAKQPLSIGDNSDDDAGTTGHVIPVTMTVTSSITKHKKAHKKTEKLFPSDSSEFDSDGSNTPPLLLQGNPPNLTAEKAVIPDLISPTVKGLRGDSSKVFVKDKVIPSDAPLVGLGTVTHVDSDSSSSDRSDVQLVAGNKSVLPNIVNNDTAGITSFAYNETLLAENDRLKEENGSLKAEINTLKEEVKTEKKRCSDLSTKVVALKKKESEETKALENMVAKVEENLVASMQRAATADVTIAELTKEIAILKAKLASQDPEVIHQQHELVLSAVREKAAYATQNLYSAAEKADHSIRELLSGVDTLKNIADILVYIDRVALTKSTS